MLPCYEGARTPVIFSCATDQGSSFIRHRNGEQRAFEATHSRGIYVKPSVHAMFIIMSELCPNNTIAVKAAVPFRFAHSDGRSRSQAAN